jgi:hypothetical protein
VAITSARDKMPFEVTPFFPRLARYNATAPTGNPAAATTAANQTAAPATAADAAPSH